MFLDNLSTSLLKICDAEHLSYEQAAEHCNCSSKHFANIVRRRSYPSLNVLENICTGFGRTPDSLLGVAPSEQYDLTYRLPMPVTQFCVYSGSGTPAAYPICPHCRCSLEREYQSYCDRCGQCLSWDAFQSATAIIHP